MNKFKFYFIVITASVLFFSCSKKEDEVTIVPPVDYAVQYPIDIALIEDYLKNNYIDIVNHPGFVDDQDVVIKKLVPGEVSIMSYLNADTYPKLLVRNVKMHNVATGYNIYYLVLRPGVGVSPCNVDGVLAAYKGTYLSRSVATEIVPSEPTATFFDEAKFPQTFFSLYGGYIGQLVVGWSEIFPQFKTGTSIEHLLPNGKPDGTIDHYDFGAGVMFIPSGLAYYSLGSSGIPAYSPLIFSIKLYNIQRSDQDNDGVFSYQEDKNNDGYVYDYRNTILFPTTPEDLIRYADDTDKDFAPDFLDVDDDGDNYTTRLEITKPEGINSGVSLYFPFDPIVDDPFTTAIETETKGIPRKFTGPLFNPSLPESSINLPTPQASDYTDSSRLRRHLDANCKPPYQN